MSSCFDIETIRIALITAEQGERRRILMDLSSFKDPELAALIANYLGDPSPAVSEAAVEALARCENRVAAEAAVLHLRSPEPAERGYALETVIRLGDHALNSINQLLADPDHNVRKFAIDALASIRALESVPVLIQALESSDALISAAAAEALGLFGHPQAIPALTGAVERGPDWLRISALSSLGRIGGDQTWHAICLTPLDSADFVKVAAVTAVAKAGAPMDQSPVYDFLTSMIDPQKPVLQEAIVKALGQWIAKEESPNLGESDFSRILTPFTQAIHTGLNSTDPNVRAAAVTCLGITDTFEKERFVGFFSNQETVVRLAALKALDFHSALCSDELVSIALDDQQDEVVRLEGLHFLANKTVCNVPLDPTLKNKLVHLVNTAHENTLQAAALRIILLSGVDEGPALTIGLLVDNAFTSDDDVWAELMMCPANALLPVALKGLEDSDSDVRWRTITNLVRSERAAEFAQLFDGRALIITALGDDDSRIRTYVISILEKCADQAWAYKYLRNACETLDDRVRARAVDALGSTGGSQGVFDLLKTLANDTSGRVRLASFKALARLGQTDEDVLQKSMLDPFLPLQHAALVMLLSSDQFLIAPPLLSTAKKIITQSTDPEIIRLGKEFEQRLSQC